MTEELKFANDLLDFIHTSPSPFHVVSTIKDLLQAKGFEKLELTERWEISKGGKYFLTRNDSAVIAFGVGQGAVEEQGFRLVGAHTDAPSFRVKPAGILFKGRWTTMWAGLSIPPWEVRAGSPLLSTTPWIS